LERFDEMDDSEQVIPTDGNIELYSAGGKSELARRKYDQMIGDPVTPKSFDQMVKLNSKKVLRSEIYHLIN